MAFMDGKNRKTPKKDALILSLLKYTLHIYADSQIISLTDEQEVFFFEPRYG